MKPYFISYNLINKMVINHNERLSDDIKQLITEKYLHIKGRKVN